MWDLEDEFERMTKRMNQMLKRMMEPMEEEIGSFGTFPVDISENEDDIVVKAELPGFEKEDVGMKVTGNTIEIAARKKQTVKELKEKMYREERKYGEVRRMLTLPAPVDIEHAQADMKDGILTVTLQKKEKKKVAKKLKVS